MWVCYPEIYIYDMLVVGLECTWTPEHLKFKCVWTVLMDRHSYRKSQQRSGISWKSWNWIRFWAIGWFLYIATVWSKMKITLIQFRTIIEIIHCNLKSQTKTERYLLPSHQNAYSRIYIKIKIYPDFNSDPTFKCPHQRLNMFRFLCNIFDFCQPAAKLYEHTSFVLREIFKEVAEIFQQYSKRHIEWNLKSRIWNSSSNDGCLKNKFDYMIVYVL